MTDIRSVISDLGKVIIFFDNDIFFKKMTHYTSLSVQQIKEMVTENFGIVESFDRGEITSEQFYHQVAEKLQAQIDYTIFYEIYNDVFSLNHPVLDILKKLKTECRLVLLSNTDNQRFGYIRERFPEILIFDHYVLSFEVGAMKPHPKIYQVALEKAEAAAEQCLFIDDREENVEAALELGMTCIHFTPQTDLAAELHRKGLRL
ncbi:MAG: HAD family hydrolase [Candidatus Aminicenantes bacterium]